MLIFQCLFYFTLAMLVYVFWQYHTLRMRYVKKDSALYRIRAEFNMLSQYLGWEFPPMRMVMDHLHALSQNSEGLPSRQGDYLGSADEVRRRLRGVYVSSVAWRPEPHTGHFPEAPEGCFKVIKDGKNWLALFRHPKAHKGATHRCVFTAMTIYEVEEWLGRNGYKYSVAPMGLYSSVPWRKA